MWTWWPAAPAVIATAALNRNRNQSTGLELSSDFIGGFPFGWSCDVLAGSDADVGRGGAVAPPGDQPEDGAGERDRVGHQECVVHPGGERGVADAGDLAGEPDRGAAGHRCRAYRDRA